MITHNVKSMIIVVAILAQPIQTRTEVSESVKTVGIIGGIVAGACAVGAGISYLCSPSNEKIIRKAHKAEDDMRLFYGSVIHHFESKNYSMNETDLITFAQSYVSGTINMRELHDLQHELSQARINLDERMYYLECKGKDYSADYRSMERAMNGITQLELSVEKVCMYLERHVPYFELYKCDVDIRRQYKDLVTLVDLNGNKPLCFAQCLREHIAVNGAFSRDLYPTISYVEKLTSTMRDLETAMQGWRNTYNYSLLTQATALYAKLSQARSVLLADDRYVFETQERERARREQERNRIERERIAAEERKAEAAERQAREMRRQNDILNEQNDILRQQVDRQYRYGDYTPRTAFYY